jgi:hypothetical protein
MKRRLRVVLMFVAGTAVLGTGCYRKVVSAQGPGADRVNIEQGNAPVDKGTRTLGYPKVSPKKLPGE